MARKRTDVPSGSVVVVEHESRVLADNPLGDPHRRKLAVYLPAQYDEGATRKTGGRGRTPRPRPPGLRTRTAIVDAAGAAGSTLGRSRFAPIHRL